jgi:riboflavin kinase/FMN adenylyltransferase
VWITSSLLTALTPTTVALGNFDGVHRGHHHVIKPILPSQQILSVQKRLAGTGIITKDACSHPVSNEVSDLTIAADYPSGNLNRPYATVLTFHPHPQEFFSGKSRLLLTPPEEKAELLQAVGVEQLLLLPFNETIARLSPQAFVETILVQQLQATTVSVGENFRFGHQRSGTALDLQAIATSFGIEVHVVPLETCHQERISSSTIRQALNEGDLERANRLLGYSYRLMGTVVQGNQLGSTLGFPTANLNIAPTKFLPRQGVYAVSVTGPTLEPNEMLGVMNLGMRPTVDGTQQVVEIHILEWSGDLYGHTLKVSLEHFLRPEQKFSSLDALKAQIQTDCKAAKAIFSARCHPTVTDFATD